MKKYKIKHKNGTIKEVTEIELAKYGLSVPKAQKGMKLPGINKKPVSNVPATENVPYPYQNQMGIKAPMAQDYGEPDTSKMFDNYGETDYTTGYNLGTGNYTPAYDQNSAYKDKTGAYIPGEYSKKLTNQVTRHNNFNKFEEDSPRLNPNVSAFGDPYLSKAVNYGMQGINNLVNIGENIHTGKRNQNNYNFQNGNVGSPYITNYQSTSYKEVPGEYRHGGYLPMAQFGQNIQQNEEIQNGMYNAFNAAGAGANFALSGINTGKGMLNMVGTNMQNAQVQQQEQQRLGQLAFSNAIDDRPIDTQFNRNALYKNGGSINDYKSMNNGGFANVEIEGGGLPNKEGEHVQLPNGFSDTITGASHSQGGVKMQLPEGTKIFSENLKLGQGKNKKSYADMAKKFETKKNVDMLKAKGADDIQKSTADMMIKFKNQKLDELFELQQQNKANGVHGYKPMMETMQEEQMPMGKYGLKLPKALNGVVIGDYEYQFDDNGKPISRKNIKVPNSLTESTTSKSYQDPDTYRKTLKTLPPSQQTGLPQNNIQTDSIKPVPQQPINFKQEPYIQPDNAYNVMTPSQVITDLPFKDITQPQYQTTELIQPKEKNTGVYTGQKGTSKRLQIQEFMKNNPWFFNQDNSKKWENFEKKSKAEQEKLVEGFQKEYTPALTKKLQEAGKSPEEINRIVNETGFTGKGVQQVDKKLGDFTMSRFIPDYNKPQAQPTAQVDTPATPEPKTNTVYQDKYKFLQPEVRNEIGINQPLYIPQVYGRVQENMVLNDPSYIDPKYLNLQPQLNQNTRAMRTFQTNNGSMAGGDKANALQAFSNNLSNNQDLYGQKYNYDRQQDATAQQFNATARMNTGQFNSQANINPYLNRISQREANIGMQQMTDQYAAMEHADKDRAFRNTEQFIRNTYPNYQNRTPEQIASGLTLRNGVLEVDEIDEPKKTKYGGFIKSKKMKIKPKIKK